MKTQASILHAMLAALPLAGMATAGAAVPENIRIILKPKNGVSEAAVHALVSARGAEETGRIAAIGARVIELPAAAAPPALEALQADPDVDYAEVDGTATAFATANDPYLANSAQWYLPKIAAPAAWDYSTGSPQAAVAVVDTGVLASHPDLAGKVDAGYDFVNNDADPSDDNGHGTAVSGLIAAATNNLTGMAGLGWSTRVLPVKVLNSSGSGTYSAIANGITWAADRGVKVINLSLGGTSSSLALQDAVNYAWSRQCVIIAAAGNNGNSTPCYPAACNNVVAVSATNSSDTRPTWSNYGSYVDLSAPGASILTLYGADTYAYWDGTSFSSPIVSGVAALMAAANPAMSNSTAVNLLVTNTDDIGTAGYDTYYGSGRVNAGKAVAAAWTLMNVDTTPPVVAIGSPRSGDIVSGTVGVNLSATDNVGVVRMELWLDGSLLAQTTASSATIPWDTTAVTDGTHTLEARAYDAVNLSSSSTVSVSVRNSVVADTTAPLTQITSPKNGTKITSKSVKVSVSATDDVGVTRVELYIDGKLYGTSATAPVTFTWNTSKLATGVHTLQSYAYDAAGNIGTSVQIGVTR